MKSSAMTTKKRCARQCEGSIFRVYPQLHSTLRAQYLRGKKKSLMSFGTRASHGDRLPPRKHECERKEAENL